MRNRYPTSSASIAQTRSSTERPARRRRPAYLMIAFQQLAGLLDVSLVGALLAGGDIPGAASGGEADHEEHGRLIERLRDSRLRWCGARSGTPGEACAPGRPASPPGRARCRGWRPRPARAREGRTGSRPGPARCCTRPRWVILVAPGSASLRVRFASVSTSVTSTSAIGFHGRRAVPDDAALDHEAHRGFQKKVAGLVARASSAERSRLLTSRPPLRKDIIFCVISIRKCDGGSQERRSVESVNYRRSTSEPGGEMNWTRKLAAPRRAAHHGGASDAVRGTCRGMWG